VARISCVTVTYGPQPEVHRMLESVARHTVRADVEVVVVTQPSDEGEQAIEESSWVRHVRLGTNEGFGVANNIGVESATGDFVALLNPDLEVTEGWSAPLIDALADDVFCAAPVLLNADGSIGEAGQVMFADGGSEAIGGARWPGERPEVFFSRDVQYASAACWMVRRDVFRELGGFDAAYAPAYFEDADLALRAASAGRRSRLVVDRPVVHHHDGASAERVALARESQIVFRERQREVLAKCPTRIGETFDAIAVRDHLCERRVVVAVDETVSDALLESTVVTAAAEARGNPRWRVTVAAPSRPCLIGLRRRHASDGLEVIDGPVETVVAARARGGAEVRWIGR